MKPCLGTGQESTESFWVKITGQVSMHAVALVICYRSPDQEEVVGQAFFIQLDEASCSQALVLMRDFSYPILQVSEIGRAHV